MSRQLALGIVIGFAAAVALLSWGSRPSAASPVDAGVPQLMLPRAHSVLPDRITMQLSPLTFAEPDGGTR